jgi:hypothetical protein
VALPEGIRLISMVGTGSGHVRWSMLAVISLSILALTLNWFDVATAFPLIGAQFKKTLVHNLHRVVGADQQEVRHIRRSRPPACARSRNGWAAIAVTRGAKSASSKRASSRRLS